MPLEQWTADAEVSRLPELRGFGSGLRKDWDAVMAGLTLRWNSGPVTGHVNRIKMLKRQMFGRAKLDLLRKRVLLSTCGSTGPACTKLTLEAGEMAVDALSVTTPPREPLFDRS